MKCYKSYFLTLLLCAFATISFAQDIITLNNGRKINGYVTEISKRELSYSRNANDRRIYTIALRDIDHVKYDNGETEYFNGKTTARNAGRNVPEEDATDYGKNQIKYYPLHFNNHGLGMALSYERSLDNKGYVSIDLPLSFSFFIPFGLRSERPEVWGFYPNLKFYPTTSRGKVRYSIGVGPSMEWGIKNFEDQVYNPNTGVTQYISGERQVERFGVTLTNALNMHPTSNFSIGMELGLGILIDADAHYMNSSNSDLDIPMIRGGLRFGFRF